MKQIDTITLSATARLIKRYFLVIFTCITCCTIAAVSITGLLDKRFKSTSILNIQTSYFQHPLVNDLITPISEPSELQAQRLSLMELALNEQFLDSMAERFGWYTKDSSALDRAKGRELLLQKIEYYPISSTSFSISVTSNEPEKAQEMTKVVLDHMQETLISERNNALDRTKKAIEGHLQGLGKSLQDLEKPEGAAKVDEELQGVESALKGLLVRFTDTHPDVIKARRQLASLKAQQTQTKPKNGESSMPAISKVPSQEVYDDLVKKLNYLTVLFSMEHGSDYQSYLGVIQTPSLPIRASFPSKRLFAVFGLMAGILLAAVIIVGCELTRRRILSSAESAIMLDAPWWGALPVLDMQAANPLLLGQTTP